MKGSPDLGQAVKTCPWSSNMPLAYCAEYPWFDSHILLYNIDPLFARVIHIFKSWLLFQFLVHAYTHLKTR